MDRYINDLMTCTGGNSDDFTSCLLSVKKVAKLTDNDPKYIYLAKAEGNLLKFLYLRPLKKLSWHSLKEKMRVKFHSSLALIICKQQGQTPIFPNWTH